MITKAFYWFCAAVSLTDAIIAIAKFDHAGDMHISWAGNSLIAAGVFVTWARRDTLSAADGIRE